MSELTTTSRADPPASRSRLKPKSSQFIQHCVKCSRTYDVGEHVTTCECSGLTIFEYPENSIEWPPSMKVGGLARYWPLLPISDPSNFIAQNGASKSPTPLYRPQRLAEILGLTNLWIKDESVNQSKTFKDRDALVTLSRFQEINVREFAMSSTGNTAAAFVYALANVKIPMKAHIFLPRGTIIDFPQGGKGNVDITLVDGDYSSAIGAARKFSEANGIPLEGGFSNPCRTEAAKTIAYEIAESNIRPDWYAQGITNGAGMYGFNKGYSELVRFGIAETAPKLLCVQPEGCAPMVKAFRGGRDKIAPQDIPADSQTFVTTLSCTNPAFSYPYVREAVLGSRGSFEEVSDRETAHALMLLLKLEGKIVDPAAAVALAGIVKAVKAGAIRRDETTVLSLSGGIRGTGVVQS